MVLIEATQEKLILGVGKKNKQEIISREEMILPDGADLDETALVRDLRAYAKANKQRFAKILLRDSETVARIKTFPPLRKNELDKAVMSQMSALLPDDAETYRMDYRVLYGGKISGAVVLMAAVKREASVRWARIAESAGLTPVCMDIYESALIEAVSDFGGVLLVLGYRTKLMVLTRAHDSAPLEMVELHFSDAEDGLRELERFWRLFGGRAPVGQRVMVRTELDWVKDFFDKRNVKTEKAEQDMALWAFWRMKA